MRIFKIEVSIEKSKGKPYYKYGIFKIRWKLQDYLFIKYIPKIAVNSIKVYIILNNLV